MESFEDEKHIKKGNIIKFEKEHIEIVNAIYEGNSELTKNYISEHLQGIKNEMFNE